MRDDKNSRQAKRDHENGYREHVKKLRHGKGKRGG